MHWIIFEYYLFQDEHETTHEKLNKSKSSCCVPNCTVTGYVLEKGRKVTFHHWPLSDSKLMNQWIVRCRRDKGKHFNITKHTKICSRHFQEKDFKITPKGRRFLKPYIVPSIFEWSKDGVTRNYTERPSPSVPSASTSLSQDVTPPSPVAVETAEELLIRNFREDLKVQNEAAELFKRERDHLRVLYGNLLQKSRVDKYKSKFSLNWFKHKDWDICFYIGFPTYKVLMKKSLQTLTFTLFIEVINIRIWAVLF